MTASPLSLPRRIRMHRDIPRRPPRREARRQARRDIPRAGFTLIEVVVAIVILGGAMITMGAFIAGMSRNVNSAQTRATAVQLATERLEAARNARRYADLDTMARTESPPSGWSGWTRTTAVTRVGGASADSVDYKIVTVTVSHATLRAPLAKTTIVAPF